MNDKPDRPTVFVSYSHKDKRHLDSLLPFLEGLELNERIELWHDRLIGVGEDWYRQLEGEMSDAKIAILLVTQNFLASRFCKFEEIPVLLQRQRAGRLAVLPVLLEPCLWKQEPWLKRLQMTPEDGPLPQSGARRLELLTELAERITEIAEKGVPPLETALESWPPEIFNLRRLPESGPLLFGRRKELALIDRAWDGGETSVLVFTAGGGVGKSALCRVWCEMLAEDDWRGARRAYAWSFYSQGTGRQSSADAFVNAAFEWFGEEIPAELSPWDRGAKLAELVRRERMLLVLDGVEPLQSPSGVDRGELRDPALETLLVELARENPGLCLVSTREPMADLAEAPEPAVIRYDLDRVSKLAGRALLRVAGVRGEDGELEAAVEALGGHALAVNLLATYAADGGGRHVGALGEVPEPDPDHGRDAHPRRVIEAWAKRLGKSAELEVLHQLGLFDRPAGGEELEALREPPAVRGLNRELQGGGYEAALVRLRELRLLDRASVHEPDTLDAHPLVRQYFGERLERTHPRTWTAGHDRLYEHLTAVTEDRPDTLAGLAPLYAALAHGCAAGRYQEALDEVYHRRISRGAEAFVVRKLGAFGAELAGLAPFFEQPWRQPVGSLTAPARAWLLGQAGFRLRALGRLAAAAEPMRAGLEAYVQQSTWRAAAIGAGNLSELELGRGEIGDAVALARQSVEHADESGDWVQRMTKRTTHADALHQAGRLDEAEALFREAEAMQAEQQPEYPHLYSLQGYEYCDLLLGQGRVQEVLERAEQTLEWAMQTQASLLSIALHHLSLGRAHLQAGARARAAPHLRQAVDGLRQAGQVQELPRGLLARAELHLAGGDLDPARADLDESLTLCARIGLRLFEADTRLGFARLHLDAGALGDAREALGEARAIIEATGFERRRPELDALEAQLETSPGSGGA